MFGAGLLVPLDAVEKSAYLTFGLAKGGGDFRRGHSLALSKVENAKDGEVIGAGWLSH